MADTLIQRLLNQGAPGLDREKVKREAEEAIRKYEEQNQVTVPEEAGIEEGDIDMLFPSGAGMPKDTLTGQVPGKPGAGVGMARMPPATRYQQAWTQALEESVKKPGAYEELMKKGKEGFIQDIIAAEKEASKQSRRRLRDIKEKVLSNKQTAESIDYGQTAKTFGTQNPPISDPKVTLRKK
jgi:hypothetical protein